MNKDIYQLKVIYTDAGNKIEGMPYRIIQFHKDTNLQQLASYILKQFGFKMSEPFGFYSDLKNWERSAHKYELFEDDPKKNTLKNTFIDEIFDLQKEFLLVYDYLEEYRFLIYYDKQVPERNVEYPELIESRGETTPATQSVLLGDEDDDDEPKYAAKKNTGGFKDEFDDYDEDDLDKLDGVEGEEEDDDAYGDDAEDEFGFDEYSKGGKEDDF